MRHRICRLPAGLLEAVQARLASEVLADACVGVGEIVVVQDARPGRGDAV